MSTLDLDVQMDALERRWRRAHESATGARAEFDSVRSVHGANSVATRAAERAWRDAERRKQEVLAEIELLEDQSID
jgi:hypothetical protein